MCKNDESKQIMQFMNVPTNISILKTYQFSINHLFFQISLTDKDIVVFTHRDIKIAYPILDSRCGKYIILPNILEFARHYNQLYNFYPSRQFPHIVDYILSFSHRPADAIEFVKQKLAHTVAHVEFKLISAEIATGSCAIAPIFFLGDLKSEVIQQQTLEAFKDIKYKWALIKNARSLISSYKFLRNTWQNTSGINTTDAIENMFVYDYNVDLQGHIATKSYNISNKHKQEQIFADRQEQILFADSYEEIKQIKQNVINYIHQIANIYSMSDIPKAKSEQYVNQYHNYMNHFNCEPIQFLFMNKNHLRYLNSL